MNSYTTFTRVLVVMVLAAVSGCAGLFPKPLSPGDTEAQVRSKWGQPMNVYRDNGTRVLEYRRGPFGQLTWLVRIGPEGRLQSAEQVRTDEKFAAVEVGKATRNDVLLTFGAPDQKSYLPLKDYEVWSYPYRENDVWNSIMHVHFDRSGVVRMLQSTPDLRFDEGPDDERLRLGAALGLL